MTRSAAVRGRVAWRARKASHASFAPRGAVALVAEHGWRLLPDYTFDEPTGQWRHRSYQRSATAVMRLADVSYSGGRMTYRVRRATEPEWALAGYLEAAERLFADAARRKALLGCAPAKPDDACASDFVKRVGRALFRRPLSAADVERWLTVARTTADGDAYRGLRYALAGMLQSPRFLYRIEVGAPDPADSSAQPRRRYDAYEMAQRLSFFLWNTTPDEELLAAAGPTYVRLSPEFVHGAGSVPDVFRAMVTFGEFARAAIQNLHCLLDVFAIFFTRDMRLAWPLAPLNLKIQTHFVFSCGNGLVGQR